jgi:3-methyladenine DNA glycosylase AlkD
MHRYVEELRALFNRHAKPGLAGPMRRLTQDHFPYLGIRRPVLAELMRKHYTRHGLPVLEELDTVVRDLWGLRYREFQYAAIDLLRMTIQELPEFFTPTVEYLLLSKAWWDTVDPLASETVGPLFKRFPRARRRHLARWRRSSNFWLRRAGILFQLKYKRETDFTLLADIIRENLDSDEFFINKAIGTALRQYSRYDADSVRRFVRETRLNPLSAREALRLLERRKAATAG